MSIETLRQDFPIFAQTGVDRPFVYLDSAVSSQKPQVVIDRLTHFYQKENANIHRGVYRLSQEATQAYEDARQTIAVHLNAASAAEIIFTRNCTEGINLVAQSWGQSHLKAGDEIIISALEHHANIVPWQMLAQRVGATLKVIPLDANADIDLEAYEKLLTDQTQLVAITGASNAIGTLTPLASMIKLAKRRGALCLVDACQLVPHAPVDVQALGADFLAFTGHKILGPNGIGVLYGRYEHLERMPPYQGGGDMIEQVFLSTRLIASHLNALKLEHLLLPMPSRWVRRSIILITFHLKL